MLRRLAAFALAVALLGLIAASPIGSPIAAQVNPIVSVDAVPDAGNTATTVGSIDSCRSTTNGATFTADVVIQQNGVISGFQANLLYAPLVLKVTGVSYSFLLASTGEPVWNLGDPAPDIDGNFLLAATTLSFISNYASGPGVLARLTFQAIGPGASPLDLTSVKLADGNGNPIPPSDASKFYTGPVNDGAVIVNSSCPPTPTPTPTATATPTSTPTPTPTATPTPTPTATPTLTPAPTATPNIDSDGDGYSDGLEQFMGTLPLVRCSATAIANDEEPDAWPPDFDDSQVVNILDVLALKPVFNSAPGDGRYIPRKDLNADGAINIVDVLGLKPYFLTTCLL